MAKDDAQPATKKEFRELKREVEGVDARLIRVESDVVEVKGKLTEVQKTVVRILDIVISIDKHFQEHKDLPDRMAEAEDDIVKIKSRVY